MHKSRDIQMPGHEPDIEAALRRIFTRISTGRPLRARQLATKQPIQPTA
jgi:hypothetical protein